MPALSSLRNPRTNARHARPSRIAPLLAAGGLATAIVVADAGVATTAAHAGGSAAQFERLAACESGGNWAINTGNGYYGGLQFNLATWRGLGLGGYPHQASKSQQIAAGQKLHSQRGWKPWPACSRKLGLRGDGGYSGTGAPVAQPRVAQPVAPKPAAQPAPAAAAPVAAAAVPAAAAPAPAAAAAAPRPAAVPARASRTRVAAPVARPARVRIAVPAFDGHVMTVADVRTRREPVRVWQRQMRARGYRLVVDGRFGPRSAAAATRLARATGTKVAPGTVDAALWAATWTAPVR